MAFFNDKWTIVNIDLDNMLLFRKSTNDILLDKIAKSANVSSKESIIKNVLEEYDIAIGLKNELYIIYQSQEMHLILTILSDDKREDIRLTSEPIPEVIDLNIVVNDNRVHIIYIIKLQDEEGKYRIYHNYYDGKDWETYIVEDIIAKKVLNPMKLIQEENNIILAYYNHDKDIELKEFGLEMLKWSDTFKLADNPNEKLYIDMIKKDDIIHLGYCEFQNENLVIKYEKFRYSDKAYKRELEKVVSNEGSLSHPTIILYENNIWITWVELNKVMSRMSDDGGLNWSDSMYTWNSGTDIDFVRYKYLTVTLEKDRTLDYSFGSVYPEIKFMGFGMLDDATELPIKKKDYMNLPRMPRI